MVSELGNHAFGIKLQAMVGPNPITHKSAWISQILFQATVIESGIRREMEAAILTVYRFEVAFRSATTQ